MKINREYVRKWRGVSPPPRVADLAISYHEEILDGSDFELEVLSFRYSTVQESVWQLFLRDAGFSEAQIAAYIADEIGIAWTNCGGMRGLSCGGGLRCFR